MSQPCNCRLIIRNLILDWFVFSLQTTAERFFMQPLTVKGGRKPYERESLFALSCFLGEYAKETGELEVFPRNYPFRFFSGSRTSGAEDIFVEWDKDGDGFPSRKKVLSLSCFGKAEICNSFLYDVLCPLPPDLGGGRIFWVACSRKACAAQGHRPGNWVVLPDRSLRLAGHRVRHRSHLMHSPTNGLITILLGNKSPEKFSSSADGLITLLSKKCKPPWLSPSGRGRE